MGDGPAAEQAARDERRWTPGAWLALALALGYLLAGGLYTLAALRQPSEGWYSGYDSSAGWVVELNQGGADVLRPGDRINAIDGLDVDQVLGPRYEPPPGWHVGGTARYSVVRAGRPIELEVPLVRRPDAELLRAFARDIFTWEVLLSVLVALGIFVLRPGSVAARLLLLVMVLFFGSLATSYASWSPAMFLFPPLLHAASLIITPWTLLFAMVSHLALSFPLRAWPLTRWPRLVLGGLYGAAGLALLALLLSWSGVEVAILGVLLGCTFLALIGAPISLLRTVRDRSARAQLGWAALGLGASFGGTLLTSVLGTLAPGLAPFSDVLGALGWLLLPICLGIAILRYRLFDIEIIIRRTLVYTALTLGLGAIYFISVVALQALFVRLTGAESTLAVVASTLAIAALFGPLRRRVQALIDRRFFRKKYDAARVLAQFAARAQQQAELDALAADVLAVVQETLEPEQATLWLRTNRS